MTEPVEPAATAVARPALQQAHDQQKSDAARTRLVVVRIALVVSLLLPIGACALIGARAVESSRLVRLWRAHMSIRAEYGCCDGETGPCREAGDALRALDTGLRQREQSVSTWLSRTAGRAIGSVDLDVGVGMDQKKIADELATCEHQMEVHRARAAARKSIEQIE